MPLNLGYGAAWGTAVRAPGPALPSDLDLGAVRVTKRSAKTRRPELMLSRGPLVYGQPGQSWNDLLGSRYALALLATGALALYQLDADWQPGTGWQRVPDDAADLPTLPGGARHLGFCFDQSGNPVICWEVSGQVYVRQFDPATRLYVVRGPFEGHDPLLSFDALHSGQIPGSDVVLFLLSAERTRLDSRLQRDLYGVMYPVAVFETPALLDQAVSLPYRLELLGEVDGAELALLSDFDTLRAHDPLSLGASGPVSGEYPLVVQTSSGTDHVGFTASGPSTGQYAAAVQVRSEAEQLSISASGPSTGQYAAAVLTGPPSIHAASFAARGPVSGQYAAAVIARTLNDELSLNASGPRAGEYTT